MEKKIIFKKMFHLGVILAALLIILGLLLIFPFTNLLSDSYFLRYKEMKRYGEPLDNQIEYLYQSINVNPYNPEYFGELANLFFESHEDDLRSINSEAALREVNQRSSFIHHPYYSKIFKSPSISSNTPVYGLMPISAHLQSIELNPINADNYLNVGLLLSNILSEDQVDALLTQAANLEPQAIYIHYAIGNRHLWNQKTKEALEEFKQVLDIAANQRTNSLIDTYLPKILSQSFLLINDVELIREIIPHHYYCYLRFAQFLAERNLPVDSKEYFYKAYETAPADKKEAILLSLAWQLARFKQWDELIKTAQIYEGIKTDNKNSPRFNLLLIQAYYNQREYEKVIQSVDNALSLDPSNATLYYYQGLSYTRLSQNMKAVQSFEKAVEYAPDNPYMHINLANAYQSTGEMQKALDEWQKVLRISSADKRYDNLTNPAISQIIKIKAYLKR
ncbi:MAG: tetratricopeptide repeat protein [Candidatus Lokiarchaeia archaeon]